MPPGGPGAEAVACDCSGCTCPSEQLLWPRTSRQADRFGGGGIWWTLRRIYPQMAEKTLQLPRALLLRALLPRALLPRTTPESIPMGRMHPPEIRWGGASARDIAESYYRELLLLLYRELLILLPRATTTTTTESYYYRDREHYYRKSTATESTSYREHHYYYPELLLREHRYYY